MKKLLAVFMCVGLFGCATFGTYATTEGYEAVLNTWVGNSESSLVSNWGTPQNSYVMSNGDRAIEYRREQNAQLGGQTYNEPQTVYHSGNINTRGNVSTYGDLNMYGNYKGHSTYSGTSTEYVSRTTPVYNVSIWCNTTFIINSSGIIQSWRWEGNSCRAVAPSSPSDNQNSNTEFNKKEDKGTIVHDEKYGNISDRAYVYLSAITGLSKTAKIDLSKTFDDYYKTKQFDAILSKESDAFQKERDRMIQEIRDAQKNMQSDVEKQKSDLIEYDKDKRAELSQKRDEKVIEILKEIKKVVAEYSEKNQIRAVFNNKMPNCKESIDITDEIIIILNGK